MDNNRYEKAKVYKIWSTKGDKIYIGSTCKKYLSQRMVQHRTSYKIWKNTNEKFITSCLIFDEYGIENCFIELIESKICFTKDEVVQLENKYLRDLDCVNKNKLGRNTSEWRIDNKEHTSNYNKEYFIKNQEKIKERNCKIITCVCGSIITYHERARHEKTIKHNQFVKSSDQ